MADIAQVEPPGIAGAASIADLSIDPSTPLYRVRSFRLLFVTRVASTTAVQMLAVVVGWHVYELTDSALQLGMIGLVQVLPPLLLMLAAGQVADRYNRRLVLRWCYAVAFCSSAGLVVVAAFPRPSLAAIYVLLLVNSSARVFEQPVMQALVPVMAPRAILNRAIAAHVSARQLSVLIGPSLGGLLYMFGATFDYGICTLLFLAAALASLRMPSPPAPPAQTKVTWETLSAGFRFIGGCQSVLGAMLLDLVSTLFGGVNALLPIYARDILEVGAWGAGVLRSAPALGALIAAAVLARSPVRRSGGIYMFVGFAVVGAATIVFGLSDNLLLSIAALMVMGCGDMLSSVVRQTLILVTTPDGMRGRVSAVNSLFYGTSGQLGAFRAGVMAAALGAVGSVVIGGCAIFATVALWVWLFPALRRVDRPDLPQPH
ncbi:MAG TPA: MFS transporter [Steroidobacteraceae bacterium]|jgi:MFS family permease|nr:MFS transporter [Steroidobacteraceae bacterium]